MNKVATSEDQRALVFNIQRGCKIQGQCYQGTSCEASSWFVHGYFFTVYSYDVSVEEEREGDRAFWCLGQVKNPDLGPCLSEGFIAVRRHRDHSSSYKE